MNDLVVLAHHRDHVIEQLSNGFARDRLDVDELERRVALAHAADSRAALDALVTDLGPAGSPSMALVPAKKMRVVMGSVERIGTWAVPGQLSARVVFGNLVRDLRDAQLGPVTEIEVSITMGNVEIVVAPGTAVDVDASSWMGNVEDRSESTPAAARVVRIAGRVKFGNLEVSTRLRGETKRDARRRRRWERRRNRILRHRHRHALPWWTE
jgi:hypothetical protein